MIYILMIMKMIIQIRIPYWLIVRDSRLSDYLWIDQRVINEWLADENDMKTVDINEDNMRIVDYVKDKYLHYLENNNE